MAQASMASGRPLPRMPRRLDKVARLLRRILLGPEASGAPRVTPSLTSEAAQAGKISDWLRLD